MERRSAIRSLTPNKVLAVIELSVIVHSSLHPEQRLHLLNDYIERRWDAAKQAWRALESAMGAVERLGGKKSDVVRVKTPIAVSVFPLWYLPATQGHLHGAHR